jgi:hypothetical protein
MSLLTLPLVASLPASNRPSFGLPLSLFWEKAALGPTGTYPPPPPRSYHKSGRLREEKKYSTYRKMRNITSIFSLNDFFALRHYTEEPLGAL